MSDIISDNIIVIAKGIVSHCHEEECNSFNIPTLKVMANDLINKADGYTQYKNNVKNEVTENVISGYLGMILAATQITGTAGGPSNDLPKDPDDKWKWWMNMFNMSLPRKSASQSKPLKRK